MTTATHDIPRLASSADSHRCDVMIAVAGAPDGVGGGVTLARSVAGVLSERRSTSRIVGWSGDVRADDSDTASLLSAGWAWRLASFQRVRQLSRWLRRQRAQPSRFIAVSPFWVVAAKRAWPDVLVSYAFPCLLANCLPFTWPNRRPPSVWARMEYEHTARVERAALETADRVVVQTDALADEVAAFAPGVANRISICPTGRPDWPAATDADRAAARASLAIADEDFVLLSVGALDLNKNVELAIRAVGSLPAEKRVRLLICGDGPEKPHLLPKTSHTNDGTRPAFIGLADRGALMALCAAADALVLTSRYDAFPNAAVEAMARGRAVIAPRHDPPHSISGIAPCIAEHDAGRLFEPGCAASLATVIAQLCDDRDAARRCGLAARRFVQSQCDWGRYIEHLIADR